MRHFPPIPLRSIGAPLPRPEPANAPKLVQQRVEPELPPHRIVCLDNQSFPSRKNSKPIIHPRREKQRVRKFAVGEADDVLRALSRGYRWNPDAAHLLNPLLEFRNGLPEFVRSSGWHLHHDPGLPSLKYGKPRRKLVRPYGQPRLAGEDGKNPEQKKKNAALHGNLRSERALPGLDPRNRKISHRGASAPDPRPIS